MHAYRPTVYLVKLILKCSTVDRSEASTFKYVQVFLIWLVSIVVYPGWLKDTCTPTIAV